MDNLAAGETDTDTFSYVVTEANGATDTVTVTITVTGVDDAPTASAGPDQTVVADGSGLREPESPGDEVPDDPRPVTQRPVEVLAEGPVTTGAVDQRSPYRIDVGPEAVQHAGRLEVAMLDLESDACRQHP